MLCGFEIKYWNMKSWEVETLMQKMSTMLLVTVLSVNFEMLTS